MGPCNRRPWGGVIVAQQLDAYVARIHPTLKPRARESMVARLRRQRREALEQIAERAAKPPMLIEDAAFTPA
jgi:hypothetical protein